MPFQKVRAEQVSDVFRQLQENYQAGQINRSLTYNFHIDEERWTVAVSPEALTVEEDNQAPFADCTLEISKEIFLGTFNGDYRPTMMDLLTGKIKVDRPEMLFGFKDILGSFL
jgi:putative sterol carrier protein